NLILPVEIDVILEESEKKFARREITRRPIGLWFIIVEVDVPSLHLNLLLRTHLVQHGQQGRLQLLQNVD
ncbi:hypothetical protein PFISCL1PPCAC_12235, partial [Pristionchus fissidentatus]